jgi:hypothetical protein
MAHAVREAAGDRTGRTTAANDSVSNLDFDLFSLLDRLAVFG